MAKLYPKRPRKGATRGEKQVLTQLEDLDDDWYVLHSLSFGGARLGEIDFVLLHRKWGMLVLEVKDGRYRVERRRWIAERRDGTEVELDRDPFQQAVEHRFALINWLKERTGIKYIPAHHCVAFTDGRPSGPLGPEAPDAIILTAATLTQPEEAILRAINNSYTRGWSSEDDFKAALTALSPSAVIAPTLDFAVDLATAEIQRLTEQQIDWTEDQIKIFTTISAPGGSHVLVLGAAGTGKTVIAQERARRITQTGAKVALIGQQRHLRLQLRRRRPNGVLCGDLIDILVDLYGLEEVARLDGSPLWETTLTLAEKFGPRLDHLIVDEAQSLDTDLLVAMRHVVRPRGSVLLLADPFQRDDTGRWKPDGEYQLSWLSRNCRNALPIAKVVAKLGGAIVAPTDGAPGPFPLFTESTNADTDVVPIVQDLLSSLSADRIVILTENAASQHSVRVALRLGKVGVQLTTDLGEDGLLISTVDSFRGCEAEAIIYVTERAEAMDRTTDYIAVSRACSYLHIVGPRSRWENYLYLIGGQP